MWAQEALYGWTDANNGVYLAVMGFSMIPVTMLMGALSARVSDRILTVFSMLLTLVGCLQLMHGGLPRCVLKSCSPTLDPGRYLFGRYAMNSMMHMTHIWLQLIIWEAVRV